MLSRSLPEAGYGARVAGPADVAALKAGDGGEILLTGGSSAASALAEHGLVDEVHVVVHPVLLGGGKPLFPAAGRRARLRRVETLPFDAGAVLLR